MKHMNDSSSSFTIVVMYAFVIVVSDGLISGCWFPTCLTKISCLIIPFSSMKGKKQKLVIFELLHLQSMRVFLTHKQASSSFPGNSSHFGICRPKKREI